MTKAILYNDLWDFYDHDGGETRCFYLPIEEEELEPYLVDYEPVVHAHWKPSILPLLQIDWFRCSNCNANAIQTPFDIPARTEFCPSCGAKMDEEVNNG